MSSQNHRLRGVFVVFVYYESIKREPNKRLIFECRCDGRLKGKGEGSTRLGCSLVTWYCEVIIKYVVYYESLKRELKTKTINECRCDDSLKTRVEESTLLALNRVFICNWIKKGESRG